jgi:membrane-bound lytic murein transglycosylase D
LREAEARLFPSSSTAAPGVLQTSPLVATASIPTGGFGDLDEPDIPVPEQPEIQTYLRFFTERGEGRALLERWLERRARYRPFVSPALEQGNLPHALEAIILAESGYHPRARSTAGAMGLWQLMPETARLYGLTVEREYDERRDPSSASVAAAKHLNMLRERLPSWELVLAAYNAGLDRVEANLASTGAKDYWSLARAPGGLPRETVLYVPKVLALSVVLENLDSLGFGRQKAATIPLPTSPSLLTPPSSAATLLSQSSRTARFPSPFAELAEPRDSHAIVVSPSESMSPFAIAEDRDVALDAAELAPELPLDGAAEAAPTTVSSLVERTYRVEPGDTLIKIASRFSVPLRLVAAQNRLDDRYVIRTGQTLRLPVIAADAGGKSEAPVTVYLASPGDTVSKIARQFGVTERELVLDNDLKNPSYVRDGQIVRIRVPRSRAQALLETAGGREAPDRSDSLGR